MASYRCSTPRGITRLLRTVRNTISPHDVLWGVCFALALILACGLADSI